MRNPNVKHSMSRLPKTLRITIENQGESSVYNLGHKEKFTIGYRPDNSLQLHGDKIPAKLELAAGKLDSYALKITDDMIGKVWAGESELSIQDLIKHNLLRKTKDGYVLEITKDKRAAIALSQFKFSFEFDAPGQGAAEYWKLRRRIVRRLTSDLLYKGILSVLMILGSSFSYYVYGLPYVELKSVNLEKYTRYVARVVINHNKVAAKPPEMKRDISKLAESESQPEATTENEPKVPPVENTVNPPAKSMVLKKGLLGLIGGTGQSSNPSTFIETLMDKGLVQEINEILQSGENLEIQLPSLTDIVGELDEILSTPGVKVEELISEMQTDEKIELREKGEVSLQQLEGIQGSGATSRLRDERSIFSVINSYRSRITYSYNKYLKLFPGLRGKIVLEVTIAATGEVTSCRIVSSTVDNREFENELISIVRSFRFKPIPDGTVTFQNPFVFFRQDF